MIYCNNIVADNLTPSATELVLFVIFSPPTIAASQFRLHTLPTHTLINGSLSFFASNIFHFLHLLFTADYTFLKPAKAIYAIHPFLLLFYATRCTHTHTYSTRNIAGVLQCFILLYNNIAKIVQRIGLWQCCSIYKS